jgi:tight adherence protein C
MSLLLVAAVALGVVLALAPRGAVARRAVRRARPELRRPAATTTRRGPRAEGPSAAFASAVARLGAAARGAARRPPDPGRDGPTGLALVVGVAASLLVSPIVGFPAALGAWAVPVLRSRNRTAAHERAVRSAIPDTVDLFRLAVGAGLSLHQALHAVAPRAPTPVDATLAEVERRVALGARLGDALDALDDLGDAALPLAAALKGSAHYGSPLGASLERVAADARVLRRRRAEEDARRLPVQLLFPLVVCVLPAFGLLAVVPLLLASLRSLQL